MIARTLSCVAYLLVLLGLFGLVLVIGGDVKPKYWGEAAFLVSLGTNIALGLDLADAPCRHGIVCPLCHRG